jgi:hypothetical protein
MVQVGSEAAGTPQYPLRGSGCNRLNQLATGGIGHAIEIESLCTSIRTKKFKDIGLLLLLSCDNVACGTRFSRTQQGVNPVTGRRSQPFHIF